MPPYGGPPGWYPGPGQGFPPGPFPPSPYGYPPGPPGHFQQPPPNQQPKPSPIGPSANKQSPPAVQPTEKPVDPKISKTAEPAAPTTPTAPLAEKAPTPPIGTKPSPGEVQATQAAISQAPAAQPATTSAPTGPKLTGRVIPAIPLASPAVQKAPLQTTAPNAVPVPATIDPAASLSAATQAATAAVAAAMAKLPPAGQGNKNAVDNLTKKVGELRTNDHVRAPRQPGGGSGFTVNRGARGGRGGARNASQTEVPKTDFDFEGANAKFNKEDLVKEAIAGSPPTENAPVALAAEAVPISGYNKSTSFFDNISSESKDRMEAGNSRPGGREWRGEEQKKNLETFGQGSVDNGYRGGYRGRGRGGRSRGGFRGRGYSGNGQPRGGSAYRGRSDAQTFA